MKEAETGPEMVPIMVSSTKGVNIQRFTSEIAGLDIPMTTISIPNLSSLAVHSLQQGGHLPTHKPPRIRTNRIVEGPLFEFSTSFEGLSPFVCVKLEGRIAIVERVSLPSLRASIGLFVASAILKCKTRDCWLDSRS